MMIKVTLCMLLLCFQVAYAAYHPKGWLWNNIPHEKEKGIDFSSLTPDEQVSVLRYYTMNALHTLDLDPTPEHAYTAALWTQFWEEKATGVTSAYSQMLLENPELDYHLQHPTESAALSVASTLTAEREKGAIQALSENYGIFFFYRGLNPYDQKLAPIIQHFAARYQVSIVPVTVDHTVLPEFPESKEDEGQTEHLGIHYFPALILVEPETQTVKPLYYGFISEDGLAKQFLKVATNFKGDKL